MPIELESRYDHSAVEARWIKEWDARACFRPEYASGQTDSASGTSKGNKKTKRKSKTEGKPSKSRKPFCIVIPPPNVTGDLHVGHALDQTVQDVLVRVHRKRGENALWLPGTDHAGIATQVRVEKNLAAEGKSRHDLGREKFIEAVWDWKKKSGGNIGRQQRLLGFSLDWSRERFTMDDGLSRAVRKVFVDLYNEGLIYRGTRLVNWDPETRTVLSDLEVEHEENFQGELYEFAYPLKDGGEVIVATTRPETMLGDTAVAVHPDDERFAHLIGKTVAHPFLDREVPIIGDAILVDREFGTGAVKITPAHDPNDYETGQRHKLEFISIFDERGRVNQNGGEFAGLDRFDARKQIKAALKAKGLERGAKPHTMSVGRSQRSNAIVEPMVSTQWFVKIEPLAKPAIKAVEDGTIRFVPDQWSRTYFHWMHEIRDWCISRQLWWGHRIPAWYGPDDHMFVAHDEAEAHEMARKHYGEDVDLRQDSDVLDTWFSSGLWPFSTLGWPEKTDDLKTFYPTSVLVTAYDIIFFWVARMIMLGLHFMKKPPFHEIYIHGLLRDEKGDKMSKTRGNVVDPLEAAATHGADAFRFFLIATITEGKDARYSEERLRGYQNFANKIWNSSRFVLMNLPDDFKPKPDKLMEFELEAEDYWILSELNQLIEQFDRSVDEYRFHIAAETSYAFAWRLFCDWYIEFIKPRIFGKTSKASGEAARQVVFYVLRQLLGVLNPIMPFITEELYSYLCTFQKPGSISEELLSTAPAPRALKLPAKSRKPATALRSLQNAIGAVRLIRAEMNIPPDRKVDLIVRTEDKSLKQVIADKTMAIQRLGRIESVRVDKNHTGAQNEAMETFDQGEVYLPLEGVMDVEKEVARLIGEQKKISGARTGIEKKLANKTFLEKAPSDVVAKERAKLEELSEKLSAIESTLKRLGAA